MKRLIAISLRGGLVAGMLLGVCALPDEASAQSYASAERTSIAIGHYARARALLVEALAEFERGREIARPDVLLDPEEWRLSLVSRTEELNRILDPKPRVTRSGVQYKANKMLIRRDRDRAPVSGYTAQDSNTYGEEQRAEELKAARALTPPVEEKSKPVVTPTTPPPSPAEQFHGVISKSAETLTPNEQLKQEALNDDIGKRVPDKAPITATEEALPPVKMEVPENETAAVTEPSPAAASSAASDEDLEISQAIEQAIKARLDKINPAESPGAEPGLSEEGTSDSGALKIDRADTVTGEDLSN